MISLKTTRQLIDRGIDPQSSLEQLINKVESLGYNGIYQYKTPQGYKFVIKHKGNMYIYRKIIAINLKEGYARIILSHDFQDYQD